MLTLRRGSVLVLLSDGLFESENARGTAYGYPRTRLIHRSSKYSAFDPDDKKEFLSSVAYSLTYKGKKKVFDEDDLIDIYNDVFRRFSLPKKEARAVARELETHTGIIVESSDASWEFSHTSIQEYLCAEYLVRTPVTEDLANKLSDYVAPLAIAVALASSPSEWLGHLVINSVRSLNWRFENTHSFFSRLILEKPRFDESEILGMAFLRLFHSYRAHGMHSVRRVLEKVSKLNGVRGSIITALDRYDMQNSMLLPNSLIEVKCLDRYRNILSGKIPPHGAFPNWLTLDS